MIIERHRVIMESTTMGCEIIVKMVLGDFLIIKRGVCVLRAEVTIKA